MAIVTRATLKSYFETDDIPTQPQFIDLIDTLLEDNSGTRIKTAYESEADTNALTDAKNTVLDNTSNTNTGNETAASIATINHATAAKSALVNADEITGQDSADTFSLIRTTWTSVKTFLRTFFDTLYQGLEDQGLSTTDSPSFAAVDVNGQFNSTEGAFSMTYASSREFGMRKTGTGAGLFKIFNDASGHLSADETFFNLFILSAGRMKFRTSENTGEIFFMEASGVKFFAEAGSGDNQLVSVYGYITAAAGRKFISWQVDDTTDQFILDREDSNILGFKVNMPLEVTGGVQIGTDVEAATAAKVGTTRYRADANNSWMEMVMQTGASTYAWVVIKTNSW